MSSVVTTGQIRSKLQPGLDVINSDYERYRCLFDKIYTTFNSFKADETCLEMRGTGYAVEKKEGEAYEMDTIGQGFVYNFVHKHFGLGFEITQEAIEDDLYLSEFVEGTRMLVNSYRSTKELMAMQPFNQAFNPNVLIADGQSLVSPSHPIANGVFSNQIGVAAGQASILIDLSQIGIERAVVAAQTMVDPAGLLIAANIESILVPPQSQFWGYRLTESIGAVGTSNNDLNPTKGMNLLPKGVIVNPYLTNGGNWFALTDVPNTRRHYIRKEFRTSFSTESKTTTVTTVGGGRYSFGMFTPRGVLGAQTAY